MNEPSQRRGLAWLLVFWALILLPSVGLGQACGFRVLVFSRTKGFRHDAQIRAGVALIQSLGRANGFAVDTTEDAGRFTSTNLAQYAAVVFLNTTGDVLDNSQQAVFEAYTRRGGGFVGVHSAADTEYAWPYYGNLLGAWFANHPATQTAQLDVLDRSHVSTSHLPARFPHTDEWYNFRTNPGNNPAIRVLMTVDERSYRGGTMGRVHPVAWYQARPGVGRSWYTGLGHTVSTYSAAFFQKHLLGGILFVSGALRQPQISSVQPYGRGSGSPVLQASARLSSSTATLVVQNGNAGSPAVLFLATCPASLSVGPYRLLVDVGPSRLLLSVPLALDGNGQAALTVPSRFALPASLGTALFAQGVQVFPTIGLSNGLQLLLTP